MIWFLIFSTFGLFSDWNLHPCKSVVGGYALKKRQDKTKQDKKTRSKYHITADEGPLMGGGGGEPY